MFAVRPRIRLLSDFCASRYAIICRAPHHNESTKVTTKQKSDLSEDESAASLPASFLNLCCHHTNKIVGMALHLPKFTSSNHPFLQYFNGKSIMQDNWGLIVFLISKAAGHQNVDNQEDKTEILRSQTTLAGVTEIIRKAHLCHKNIINIQKDSKVVESNDMNVGNKVALLTGDYMLAIAAGILAKLKNYHVSEIMLSTLKDLAESEFTGRRDNQNNPLPSVPSIDRTDYAVKEWTLINELSGGILLGKACKASLKLAKHNEEIQEQGYNFGKHLVLAWEANRDLNLFVSKDKINPFNLCSAPVMFHIDSDPSILTEIGNGLESVSNVNYAKVHSIVISGPGIELTKQLHRKHLQRAMEELSVFKNSDAKKALSNILTEMEDYST